VVEDQETRFILNVIDDLCNFSTYFVKKIKVPQTHGAQGQQPRIKISTIMLNLCSLYFAAILHIYANFQLNE
jgi:hypothetical protein